MLMMMTMMMMLIMMMTSSIIIMENCQNQLFLVGLYVAAAHEGVAFCWAPLPCQFPWTVLAGSNAGTANVGLLLDTDTWKMIPERCPTGDHPNTFRSHMRPFGFARKAEENVMVLLKLM